MSRSSEKPGVKEFVDFYMKNAEKLPEVKPCRCAGLRRSTSNNVKDGKKAVLAAKNEVGGITIEELMKREAKM